MEINRFLFLLLLLLLMHTKAIILLDNLIQEKREKLITQYLLRNCGCDFVINNVPNCRHTVFNNKLLKQKSTLFHISSPQSNLSQKTYAIFVFSPAIILPQTIPAAIG